MNLPDTFKKWQVPMRTGHRFTTYAVTPFEPSDDPAVYDALIEKIMRTFNNERIDIQIKKQHTKEFLDSFNAREDDYKLVQLVNSGRS